MTSQALYDDKMLMIELASGDEEAFKHFYLQYADVVFSLVLKYVKSTDAAKNITQDVFIKVWEKRAHFPNIEHVVTYVCDAARNRAIDLLNATSGSDVNAVRNHASLSPSAVSKCE